MPLKRLQAAIRGTSEVSVLGLATSTAIWNSWMRVAIEHEASAKVARARLVREHAVTGEFGEAMNEELHASMVAITASTFALDGFYGTVLQWIELPEELLAAWSACNRHPGMSGLQRSPAGSAG
jgi:hypothetical protein